MSEDAISAADLGDAGSRGERRRALRAERERQAERETRPEQPQREQPQDLPLVRPYAVTLQGHDSAVLVAGAPDTPEGGGQAGGSAPDAARSVPPSGPGEPATAHPLDADAPSPFTPGADAPSLFTADAGQRAPLLGERDLPSLPGADEDVPPPPGRRPRNGALPFDLPPFALPSDPQPSEWSAFTPVIPPEPLPVDERRPSAWAPRETWTSSDTTPSDSWMALSPSPSPSPEPAEPNADVSARTAADESAWTVPTPEAGLPTEPPGPQERVDEWAREPAAGATNSPGGAGGRLADHEDVPPPSLRPAWSADLSRVGLFRSALEDLAQGPGDAAGERPSQEPSADESRADESPGREFPADDEPPADELPADEVPADELPADQTHAGVRPVDLPVTEERWDEEPAAGAKSTDDSTTDESSTDDSSTDGSSTGRLPTGEGSTDELPATVLGVPASSGGSPSDERQPTELSWDELPPADESPADEVASEGLPIHPPVPVFQSAPALLQEWPSDEPSSGEEPPRGELVDGPYPQAFADGERDGDVSGSVSLAEPLAGPLGERPEPRPDDHEGSDGALPELGLPPVASAPAPPPPALPVAPPRPDDTHLPPLGRQAFGRAPTQRFAEALAHGEGPHPSEDDEPVRGTVAPVLRRSTERVRYPTSTMPVIRPPVMPPTPGSGIQIAPSRGGAVSWQQALSGDVVPAKKKKQPRRARVSKPRHESGGMGEYRPKVAADRSLTLLVVAMLLVLAGLVAAAVWTFWPSVSGRAGSLPPSGAPRAVGGP